MSLRYPKVMFPLNKLPTPSYGAVGSKGLVGLASSTGSLAPPPMNGLNLGLFSGSNQLK